jgi:hypothetical protein
MTLSDAPTPRRQFLGQIASSAFVLAGTAACAGPLTAAQSAPTPNPAPPSAARGTPQHWDDSWTGRLTAKHKAVFDGPEINDGIALDMAVGYLNGMRAALSAASSADAQAVVVIRHAAVPMLYNDAIWMKYHVGKEDKIKNPATDKWATGNPFARSDGSGSTTDAGTEPASTIAWLASHGHILLGCDLATRGYAHVFGHRAGADWHAVYEELKANLLPGVILQPNGVYAVHRAQEAGCTYIRST